MFSLFRRFLPGNLRVVIAYDDHAKVYYIQESDFPGLHVEGETVEEIMNESRLAISELIAANGLPRSKNSSRSHRLHYEIEDTVPAVA